MEGKQQPVARLVDLSGVTVLRKNWYGPTISIPWNSYTGKVSAVGTRKITEIDPAVKLGQYLEIQELTDGSGDLAGVPKMAANDSTLEMTWHDRGKEARIDFAPYFMIRPFPIPQGTRARIPVVFTNLPGIGNCMVIKFSGTTYKAITKKEQAQAPAQPEQQ